MHIYCEFGGISHLVWILKLLSAARGKRSTAHDLETVTLSEPAILRVLITALMATRCYPYSPTSGDSYLFLLWCGKM